MNGMLAQDCVIVTWKCLLLAFVLFKLYVLEAEKLFFITSLCFNVKTTKILLWQKPEDWRPETLVSVWRLHCCVYVYEF